MWGRKETAVPVPSWRNFTAVVAQLPWQFTVQEHVYVCVCVCARRRRNTQGWRADVLNGVIVT